jgi:hypothetical protein
LNRNDQILIVWKKSQVMVKYSLPLPDFYVICQFGTWNSEVFENNFGG